MINGHYANNFSRDGVPTGGCASGQGFAITWQDGPLGRDEHRVTPNGAFLEDVLMACKQRLEFFQESQFACSTNAMAITSIGEALEALASRTREREGRKVEGTHNV